MSGCKHIGFASSEGMLQSRKLMLEGYKEALDEIGLKFDEDRVVMKQIDHYSKFKKAIRPLFKKPLDGLVACNESLAIAAMQVAQKKGLKVPKEFSVIGFSNGILSRHSNPKLTTISKHGELMGEMSARLLIEKLEKKQSEESYVKRIIATDIVSRHSTKLIKS